MRNNIKVGRGGGYEVRRKRDKGKTKSWRKEAVIGENIHEEESRKAEGAKGAKS